MYIFFDFKSKIIGLKPIKKYSRSINSNEKNMRLISPTGKEYTSIPLHKKLANIQVVNSKDIMRRLKREGRLPYEDVDKMMSIIKRFFDGIIEEVADGKKVQMRLIGNFYPAKLPQKSAYHNYRTGKIVPLNCSRTVLRFQQRRATKEYFRAHFKGIKYKDDK